MQNFMQFFCVPMYVVCECVNVRIRHFIHKEGITEELSRHIELFHTI